MQQVIARLVTHGHSERSALNKAELLGRCISELGGKMPAFAFFVPGRIEVLGKHTDYAGGRSLTCALDRGIMVAVNPRSDDHILAHACDLDQSAGFEFTPDLVVRPDGWANYVMTVARRLARNFPGPRGLHGADIAFASDLPHAGGMSSSSALVIATWLALNAANGFDRRPEYAKEIRVMEDLAGYLGTCENGQNFGSLAGDKGVGTFGGSEDHTAILCSRPGDLNLYTYNPVRLERRIPLPEDLALVIAVSGVRAQKTAEAKEQFNRLSLLTRAIMDTLAAQGWQKPTLAAAIGDDREAAACVSQILQTVRHPQFKPAELMERFGQFAQEHQQIIPRAVDALAAKDWTKLGILVEQSQALAESGLHNQVAETSALTRMARERKATAASAFGAGFGGSVWAMVNRDEASAFAKAWREAYVIAFPQYANACDVFVTAPVGGALRCL